MLQRGPKGGTFYVTSGGYKKYCRSPAASNKVKPRKGQTIKEFQPPKKSTLYIVPISDDRRNRMSYFEIEPGLIREIELAAKKGTRYIEGEFQWHSTDTHFYRHMEEMDHAKTRIKGVAIVPTKVVEKNGTPIQLVMPRYHVKNGKEWVERVTSTVTRIDDWDDYVRQVHQRHNKTHGSMRVELVGTIYGPVGGVWSRLIVG